MSNRTNTDFSKHQLDIKKKEGISIYRLHLNFSHSKSVVFINANGVMAVTGDYYNWIFCREFNPEKEVQVDDRYWAEKLEINSGQKAYEFSPTQTVDMLNEYINDADEYWNEEKANEVREYYQGCIDNVGQDGNEYQYYALTNLPSFLEPGQIAYETELKYGLRFIYDAYEEVIAKVKSEKPTQKQ